jgi:hypothetical protein
MFRFLAILNQPFPDRATGRQNLKNFAGIGVFVFLFLFILEPFGIEGNWKKTLPICLGFGVITVVLGWGYETASTKVFKLKTYGPGWTLGKWIMHSMGLIAVIAIGNIGFVAYLFGYEWMDGFFPLQMFANTLIVGFFPVVVSGLVVQLKESKRYIAEAGTIHPAKHAVSVHGEVVDLPNDSGDRVRIQVDAFKYAEAMQNYVAVYVLEEERLNRLVIRSTIKKVADALSHSNSIRCHRSYIVNTDSVESVDGNAQGLKLTLTGVEGTFVPVSRSYISTVKEKIEA